MQNFDKIIDNIVNKINFYYFIVKKINKKESKRHTQYHRARGFELVTTDDVTLNLCIFPIG